MTHFSLPVNPNLGKIASVGLKGTSAPHQRVGVLHMKRRAKTMQYNYETFLKQLGARLKQMRQERNWTLRDMVVEHRFHVTHWQKFEGGKGISIASLLRVCEVFAVPLKEMVADLGEVEPEQDADARPPQAKLTKKPAKRAGPSTGSAQPAISRRTSSASATSQTTELATPESKTGTRRSTRSSKQL